MPFHADAPRHATARGSVLAFSSLGITFGAWLAILPAVRVAAHASSGQLGLAMLCGAISALPGMWLGGRIGDRWPGRGTALALVVLAAGTMLVLVARTPLELAVAMVAWGSCGSMVNLAMNADVARSEQATGRPAMQRAHACFSSGLLCGSVGSAALLAAGAPSTAVMVLAGSIAVVAAAGNLRRTSAPPGGDETIRDATSRTTDPGRDFPTEPAPLPGGVGYVLLLGIAAALGRIVEADVQNWSTIHLHDTLHASAALAATGPSAFAVSMVAMRLGADRLLVGIDRHRVLVCSGLVSACSTAAFAFAPNPLVGLVALAVSGASLSVVVPVLFSLSAAAASGVGAGRAIARVAGVSWLASLGGPPAIGALADAYGMRTALGLAALAGVGLAVAGLLAIRMSEPFPTRRRIRQLQGAPAAAR